MKTIQKRFTFNPMPDIFPNTNYEIPDNIEKPEIASKQFLFDTKYYKVKLENNSLCFSPATYVTEDEEGLLWVGVGGEEDIQVSEDDLIEPDEYENSCLKLAITPYTISSEQVKTLQNALDIVVNGRTSERRDAFYALIEYFDIGEVIIPDGKKVTGQEIEEFNKKEQEIWAAKQRHETQHNPTDENNLEEKKTTETRAKIIKIDENRPDN